MEATIFYLLMPQKWKTLKTKPYPLCLKNISRHFATNNMERTVLNGCFSVDYNIIDISGIINIHKYLMKKHDMKSCLD